MIAVLIFGTFDVFHVGHLHTTAVIGKFRL
jgi:glycerol-3-phosphate cytidylyltransferase-like family protein